MVKIKNKQEFNNRIRDMTNRIRDLREDMDLRQSDLAEKTGIDQRTISNYETGKDFTRFRCVDKTCRLFWSLYQLFSWTRQVRFLRSVKKKQANRTNATRIRRIEKILTKIAQLHFQST